MQRSTHHKKKQITVCYHGGCMDGFSSASLISLLEISCKNLKLDLTELLIENWVKKEEEKSLRIITDEELITKDPKIPKFKGKNERINNYMSNLNWVAFHHSNTHNAYRIIKTQLRGNSKKILLILDIGNFQFAVDMAEHFETVIFVDHHITFKKDFDKNLPKGEIPENISFIYNGTYCASYIINNLLLALPGAPLQEFFSEKFGKNLEFFKDWINQNDTLDLAKRTKETNEFKEAVFSMSIINAFNKGSIERTVQKFYSLDPDVYLEIGKPKLEKLMVDIGVEMKKVKKCSFVYKNSKGEEISRKCLFIVTTLGNRSDLGHYMALESRDRGMDPMAVAIAKRERFVKNFGGRGKRKKNKRTTIYLVSLRSIDEDETVDVDEIAACFGGGGHKRASGFSTDDLKMFSIEELGEDDDDDTEDGDAEEGDGTKKGEENDEDDADAEKGDENDEDNAGNDN